MPPTLMRASAGNAANPITASVAETRRKPKPCASNSAEPRSHAMLKARETRTRSSPMRANQLKT